VHARDIPHQGTDGLSKVPEALAIASLHLQANVSEVRHVRQRSERRSRRW
jgi:hypothetical protein